MHGDALGVLDMEPEPAEQSRERIEAVEREMLVIQRVPLELLEKIAGVHHFQAEPAAIAERLVSRLEDLFRLVVMGKGVAAGHNVGSAVFLAYTAGNFCVEVPGNDFQALLAGRFRNVLETSTPTASTPRRSRCEQHPIVAAEFDNPCRAIADAQPLGIYIEVIHQRADRAGGKRIVLKEDFGNLMDRGSGRERNRRRREF